MRPVEVTDEEIIEAGQALLAADQRITGFALRKQLGGRGTPTRLRAVWEAHEAQATPAAPPAPELPAEVASTLQAVTSDLAARLLRLASDLNQAAVRDADQRVAKAEQKADAKEQAAQREVDDATANVLELEAQKADLRTALDAERAKVASAGEGAQRQAVELATVRERLTSVELAARQATEVHAADLAQARAEAKQLRAELDQVREDLTRQLTEQTAQVSARDQLLADVREQHQVERAAAAKEVQRQAERVAQVQRECDAARKEAQEARESAARLQGEAQTLRGRGDELAALLKAFGTVPPAEASSTAAPARRKAGGS
jgi:colicin import membrane protein